MGILNITPDSFYQGYLGEPVQAIVQRAVQQVAEGAEILDIGGQSSRPGSAVISAAAEMDRVLPVIEAVHTALPDTLLSVDTYYAAVAKAAVAAGVSFINDISGGMLDPAMLQAAGELKVPYICMHMQGTPQTMQLHPVYENVTGDILHYFEGRIAAAAAAGIQDIIIDPGFGFGKTVADNFEILKNMQHFTALGKPVLAGISRKSFIYKTIGGSAADALNGTTALHMLALQNGASLLRVHDVKAAAEVVLLYETYKKAPRL